jgi:predicted PurR-regulated permease PerM
MGANEFEQRPAAQRRLFVLLLVVITLYLSFLTVQAFLQSLIVAGILASFCSPLQLWLERSFRGRRSLAALVLTLLVALVVVLPVAGLLFALIGEGVRSVQRIQQWTQGGGLQSLLGHPFAVRLLTWIKESPIAEGFDFSSQASSMAEKAAQVLLQAGHRILSGSTGIIAQFFVMLFVLFYLNRDGREMLASAKQFLPLREDQGNRILSRVRDVSRSVLLGSIGTAFCHAIVGAVAFGLVGIPVLFWGALMGFTSLLPVVGTAAVWAPAGAYLLLTGRWKGCIFLVAWCAILGSVVEHIVRPHLMGGAGGLSPFLVFLALIGGLAYFGLPGLLYGPLIFSVTAVVLYLYKEEFIPET